MDREGAECTVKVAVHVRPLIEKEESEGCEKCVFVKPQEQDVVYPRGSGQGFPFDYVFGSDGRDSLTLHDVCGRPLVEEVLKGFNATILAYGQTGSGKTYTMGTGVTRLGQPEGLANKTIREVFSRLSQASDRSWKASVSFVELHREEIRDLLSTNPTPAGGLFLRENPGRGVHIAGVVEREVKTARDVETCLADGSRTRATAATEMNLTSSRSHAILTLSIEQTVTNDGGDTEILRSKFHLVDLAGSERVKRTKAEGQRFREGVSINKGLLALGKVISALVDSISSSGFVHVPYRDSKLTRLLQDSLGGNSQTILIACVSPADVNLDETLNTLKYAARARKIRNRVVKNVDHEDPSAEIASLKMQLEAAKDQIVVLRSGDDALIRNELTRCQEENKKLRKRIGILQCQLRMRQEGEGDYGGDAVDAIESASEDGGAWETLSEEEGFESPSDERDSGSSTSSDDEEKENFSPEACKGGEALHSDAREQKNADVRLQLSREMEELEMQLSEKQAEMAKMEQMVGRAAELQSSYERHVETLETEKDRLRNKLKDIERNNNAARAEERSKYRVKLKDLESRISNLRVQLKETEQLRREREGAEEQRQKLRSDIVLIKQQKAKLAKQMEASAKTHRDEVRSKNHEIAQLKKADMKKTLRVQRLQQRETLREELLSRKNKEAETIKKRLKEAMARLEGTIAKHSTTARKPSRVNLAATIEKQIQNHFSGKAEIENLRKAANKEQRERAEKAKEAERIKRQGGDSSSLQAAISDHSRRLNEAQTRLMALRGQHEGQTADDRRWNDVRSSTDARAMLRVMFTKITDSRARISALEGELSEKEAELDVALMRLQVEESARDAREKLSSQDKPARTSLKDYSSPSSIGRLSCSSLIIDDRKTEVDDPAPNVRRSDRRIQLAADRQYLNREDDDELHSLSSDTAEVQLDDVNDPEWLLKNATPFISRRRKRNGSNSTDSSVRSRSGGADPESEELVLGLVNRERLANSEELLKRLTVAHLRNFLKSKTINGQPCRLVGKDKAGLISDALLLL